jgi:hypothetical protein
VTFVSFVVAQTESGGQRPDWRMTNKTNDKREGAMAWMKVLSLFFFFNPILVQHASFG